VGGFQSGTGGGHRCAGRDGICGEGACIDRSTAACAGRRPAGAGPAGDRGPEALGEALRRKGAVLRSCGNYPGLDASWYRTAVRTENENRQLLALLAETLPEVAQ